MQKWFVRSLFATAIIGAAASSAKADEFDLKALIVNSKIKAGSYYPVALSYEVSGEPYLVNACYLWSGEGPYCFKVTNKKEDFKIVSRLRTKNPGKYKLEGFVKYKSGGQYKESNHVFATIEVVR